MLTLGKPYDNIQSTGKPNTALENGGIYNMNRPVIEMKRSDFVVLHNKLNEAIWKIGATTNEKKRYDSRGNNGSF